MVMTPNFSNNFPVFSPIPFKELIGSLLLFIMLLPAPVHLNLI